MRGKYCGRFPPIFGGDHFSEIASPSYEGEIFTQVPPHGWGGSDLPDFPPIYGGKMERVMESELADKELFNPKPDGGGGGPVAHITESTSGKRRFYHSGKRGYYISVFDLPNGTGRFYHSVKLYC